jgi:CRISPR-associated protein Csd1
MINALCDFGKRIREEQAHDEEQVHDAITNTPIAVDLLINQDGSFDSFLVLPDNITTKGEALTSKKGQARLLVDKAEEMLGYINEKNVEKLEKDALKKGKKTDDIKKNYVKGVKSKYDLFQSKLKLFSDVSVLKPVFSFYNENKENGVDIAVKEFPNQIDSKTQEKNIVFRLVKNNERLNEKSEIIEAIIAHFEQEQQEQLSKSNTKCSICGKTKFPVTDKPHGMIKRVPDGQSSGSALVSYNEKAFESYGLSKNENSSICTNCARNYVEGLNRLLSDGYEKVVKDKKGQVVRDKNGKEKIVWVYNNRRDFGSKDTTTIYWTRNNSVVEEVDLLDEPNEKQIGLLFDSVATGKNIQLQDTDLFYSCTLSGAAARIAIRDWIEISLVDYRQNIVEWFKDIAIAVFDFDSKKQKIYRAPIRLLAKTVESAASTSDMLKSRVIPYLWSAAIKRTIPPLWILQTVLKQTRYIEYFKSGNNKNKPKEPITKERAAIIRLILNRNNRGGIIMKTEIDQSNKSVAYVCGQIFAVLVDIQKAALGKDINAGIRERFFSFASTTPAAAFGQLLQRSQNHLTKLKNSDKTYLYNFFDKKLQSVCNDVKYCFPQTFTLEEQGQFALGYYHKKQETRKFAENNPELKEVLDDEDEQNEDNQNGDDQNTGKTISTDENSHE